MSTNLETILTPTTTEGFGLLEDQNAPKHERLSKDQVKTAQNSNSSSKLNILTGNDAPWPGYVYIISHGDSNKVLTYKDKKVIIADYEGKSTQRWVCHSRDGWVGLANDPGETTHFLGFDNPEDKEPKIGCAAVHLNVWEMFCVRKRPEEGFVILMRFKDTLRPMRLNKEGNLIVGRNWDHWWGFTKIH
ncbi:hypothetical protein TWF281_005697 [Arthrobotrys megalospora]